MSRDSLVVKFLFYPSELYPEVADGGIEAPVGQDFTIIKSRHGVNVLIRLAQE